eukprot:TRINITY_DN37928_c0_g1_i1.p1 TRINITY_DN37928_c0_g1~~TRINITY_DN37928_c0_g1_i1.p1  ORF type:complete len:306 (+),score=37.81 TRINITY_DN37928_c0_g1_i1:137-1054(+)
MRCTFVRILTHLLTCSSFWFSWYMEASAQLLQRPSLTDLLREHKVGKMSQHGYHRYYEREFAHYRDREDLRILEIGVEYGTSMKVWVEYFSRASAVQGILYQNKWPYEEWQVEARRNAACQNRKHLCPIVKIYQFDQSDVAELKALVAKEPQGYDIIIDDGSHVPRHQLISFTHLFPHLRPGGLYVVEDVESSYVDTGTSYGHVLNGGIGRRSGNVVERFKDLVDVVMRAHFLHNNFTVLGQDVDRDIVRISFGDGLLFVEKRPADLDWRSYRYPQAHRHVFKKEAFAASVKEYEARLRNEEPFT